MNIDLSKDEVKSLLSVMRKLEESVQREEMSMMPEFYSLQKKLQNAL